MDADAAMLQLSPLTQTSGSTPNPSPEFQQVMSSQCAGASGDGRDVAHRRHEESSVQDYPEGGGSILVRQMMQTQMQFSPELLQAVSEA